MNESILKALSYIAARLKEPSTYPAIVLVLIALGRQLSPDQKDAIMVIGLFLAGLIGAVLPDRIGQKTRADDKPPAVPTPDQTQPLK